jgi:hypothetical protein
MSVRPHLSRIGYLGVPVLRDRFVVLHFRPDDSKAR